MRRFIDEDETPAATTRRRNRAAEARHGFGSPEGMELKDFTGEVPTVEESETGGPSSQQPFVRHLPEKGDSNVYLALADLASPPPPILTMSTESETPTPPSLTTGGRRTPPDVADELVKREASSPSRDPGRKEGLDAVHTPPATSPRNQFSGMFASPSTSFVSTSSSPHNLGTPTLPSFQPTSYVSPVALHARLSQAFAEAGKEGTDSIDVDMTPDRDTYVSDVDESISGSDTSFKETLSDQVRSLNNLLLSTGKRLGKLGETSMTPDLDNDNLTKEEECLEEVRRQLQEELSMVDFSILKDSPNATPKRHRTPSRGTRGKSPSDESASRKLEWSQLDQSVGGSSPATVNPRPSTHRRHQSLSTAAETPSSINSAWGTELVSPSVPWSWKPPLSKSAATLKAVASPPTKEGLAQPSSSRNENDESTRSIPLLVFESNESPASSPREEFLATPRTDRHEQDERTTSFPLTVLESNEFPALAPTGEMVTITSSVRPEQEGNTASFPSRIFESNESPPSPPTEKIFTTSSTRLEKAANSTIAPLVIFESNESSISSNRSEQHADTTSIPSLVVESNESSPLPAKEELVAMSTSSRHDNDALPSRPTEVLVTESISAARRGEDVSSTSFPTSVPLIFESKESPASFPAEDMPKKSTDAAREDYAITTSIPVVVCESSEGPLSNPVSSSPKASMQPATILLEECQPIEESSTDPPRLRRRSPTYPSRNPLIDQGASNTGSPESTLSKGDDPSIPNYLAQYGISSGYISSSVEGSDDDNDIISTSASDDSGYFPNDRPSDEEGEPQKKSPMMQDKKSSSKGGRLLSTGSTTPKAQNIRQIKEDTVVSTNIASSLRQSQTIRRYLAPEPPRSELLNETEKTTSHQSEVESFYAQKIVSGKDPSVTTGDSVVERKGEDVRRSRLWKDSKHSGSQGIHTTPASFPSGKHRVGSSMTLASIETGDENETRAVQVHGTAIPSSKFPFASSDLTSDETNVAMCDSSHSSSTETVGKLTKFQPEAQELSYDTKLGIREVASMALVQNVDFTGNIVSPSIHKRTGRDLPVQVKYADSAIGDVDHSNMMFSNSLNDLEEQQSQHSDDFEKTKKRPAIERCYFLPLLVVAAACLIVLFRLGVLGPDSSKVSPALSMASNATTVAPSASRFQSDTPTATPIPTTPLPSSSLRPTLSPTIFTVSFESVYEILIQNGTADDIQQEEYENDLIASMDRLLVKVLATLPSDDSQMPPRRRERMTTAIVQPSDITKFQTMDCPNRDSRNRCEQVFAYITLQNARDSWTDLKIYLDLAVISGQLQFELDQVNPGSPVAIIDMIEDLEPSPVPSALPTLSVTPTMLLALQTPSKSPSFMPLSPTSNESALFDLLTKNSFDRGDALRTQGSAQHKAYLWLLENTFLDLYADDRILQRYALATFFYSTNGEDWFFQTNWLGDMNECYWYSRSPRLPCDLSGGFQNLELDYNNLNGELPPELGLLSNTLERIVLRGGPTFHTAGTVPTELAYLTKMTYVNVRGNHFSGSLPSQLGQWTSLEQVDIADNRFTGTLPPSLLANAVDLRIMDISNNRFSGSLPTEVGRLDSCQRLNIENNMITGPIPTEIGDLLKLQSFHGGSNMLSSLPSEIGRLTFLDTLSLQQNAFTGTIPRQLSRCQRLLILDLSSNSLSGPIPSQLGNLIAMRDRIDLSFNRLTGTIPSELGKLDSLRGLFLENNKLSGTVPAELSGLTRITTVRIGTNDLTGTLPFQLCEVFNETLPGFSGDCAEFDDNGPCMTTCCVDDEDCRCRYTGTAQEFLCFQQKL